MRREYQRAGARQAKPRWLGTTSPLALSSLLPASLALSSFIFVAEAMPARADNCFTASGNPFLVGFARGSDPVGGGQTHCGTENGFTIHSAGNGQINLTAPIFFMIGADTVNGNVILAQGSFLNNLGFAAAPAAVQGQIVAFNLSRGLPAIFPGNLPGGLVITQSSIAGFVANGGTIHGGFITPVGSGLPFAGEQFPATNGILITRTVFSGPTAGIINSGLMQLSSGPANFVQPRMLGPFAVSGITLNGSTLAGDITNSGTIMASATAAANGVSAKGIVLGGGPDFGRSPAAMNFTGNIVNSGTLAISADGAGVSATGIEVDAAAGTTHAGIVNSGVINVVGTNGATSVGIKASTPITGGIVNTGILAAGTAAIDLTQETGGSTVITQAAGLTAGNVLGGGGDVLNLTGGTLALSATNRVAGLASFTQGAGGTLALQVTPSTAPGTFPTIHAGTIALGGTLQVLPSGVLANYVNGVTFRDVFSASAPITGSFASITTQIPLLTASVTPDTADAFNLVLGLDRQALAASAQDLTQSLRFGLDAQRTLIGSVQDRLVIGEDYDGGGALGDGSPLANGQLQKPERGNVWARAYGVVGNASASEGAPSYSTNAAGFIVGADWKAAPNFLIGVAANYAASSLDFADGGRTNVASYQGAIYTGWNSGPWYATGIAALGVNAFGTSRQLAALGLPGSATSSPNGQSYAGYAETGYRFSQQGFAVTPYAGLGYIHAHVDGFTETGGFGALAVNAGSSDSLSTDLGVRLATSFSIAGLSPITPEVKLGWRHEFLDAAQTLTAAVAGLPGSDFIVKGTNFGRESAVVGLTATQALGSSARLFVAYDGQFSRKLDEHVFTAGFKASF